ncbi:MAG: tetratricopeptide repeat protein [Acidobacteria bacterium]|nr:tetratricopeptide repeat protein [Acidobacteriota bacterium]
MVREIPSIKRPVKSGITDTLYRRLHSAVFILAAAFLAIPPAAKAESPASKNREGNRLFNEGKYEEAEKAYLEAQVKKPGKPEIIYNLGNSLIKQEKYPQGIQALQQSADKGDEQIRTNSLYNTGNALYSTGDYRGSAEAFIEALKLNPEDRDAKHNLELALQKLREQEKKQQQDANRDRNNPDDQKDPESNENKGEQSQQNEQERKRPETQNNQDKPAKMKPEPTVPREGSITREQARQILDAMRNQELDQQRKLMESRSRPRSNERDW